MSSYNMLCYVAVHHISYHIISYHSARPRHPAKLAPAAPPEVEAGGPDYIAAGRGDGAVCVVVLML